jgi:hypothetical protein
VESGGCFGGDDRSVFAGRPVHIVAVIVGALLLITRRLKPERVYRGIDWGLLLMFIGLFIVIAGVEKTRLAEDRFAFASRYHLERTARHFLGAPVKPRQQRSGGAGLQEHGAETGRSRAGVADAGDVVDAGRTWRCWDRWPTLLWWSARGGK